MRWPVISTISLTCTRRRLDDRRVAGVHPCFAELIPTPPHVTIAVSRRGHRHPKTEGWGGDTPTYTQRRACLNTAHVAGRTTAAASAARTLTTWRTSGPASAGSTTRAALCALGPIVALERALRDMSQRDLADVPVAARGDAAGAGAGRARARRSDDGPVVFVRVGGWSLTHVVDQAGAGGDEDEEREDRQGPSTLVGDHHEQRERHREQRTPGCTTQSRKRGSRRRDEVLFLELDRLDIVALALGEGQVLTLRPWRAHLRW